MPTVKYHYDAFGNRIWKETRDAEKDDLLSRTVYIRDAGGRELATYSISPAGSNLLRELEEQAIYGLSRIGISDATNFVKTASCSTKICTLALSDWEAKAMMDEVHQPLQLQILSPLF